MNRTRMIAALTLSIIGLGACADTTATRLSGGVGADNRHVEGLTVGASLGDLAVDALVSGAAVGVAPDDAVDAPNGRNRMHIGKPLSQAR